MMDLLRRLFTSDEFLPLGHCYLWNPGLVWLHLLSDLLIGCVYLAIPLILFAAVRRIRIPFSAMIIAFGVFTGACGLTHLMEVVTLWDPIYWIGGGIKAVTAVASVATGILLVPIRPKVVEIARAAQLSEERRLQLEEKTSELTALFEKVKEVDALKAKFLADVSHELRAPLSLVLGPVERMLGEDRLTGEDRRDLEIVARNGRTLLELVNDLLDGSRLETGRAEVRPEQADVSSAVRDTPAPGVPVAPAAGPPLLRKPEDELAPAPEEPRLEPGKPVALVVVADPELREVLRRSLGPGLAVATARDGREGLAKALALRPDLVVTDPTMPDKGGEDLLQELRAHPELTAPVLFLTAREDPELRLRLLHAGGQDFLSRPFAPEELKARAANLVATKRTRELLQEETGSQAIDLETLARELVARRHQLEIALESARLAQQQAEKASQAKTLFLGLVSHELRTPMAMLQLNLHALEEEELAGRPRELLERLQRSSGRLIDLIESVLEFTRLESGRCAPQVRAFDARPVAAEVVDELRAHAQQKLLDLRLAASPPLPPLHSDPRLVRLILINLVLNAVKYTERGHVELSLGYERGRHRLAVSDTGPGVGRDAQARIFEPLQGAQPLLEKQQPGLGLALVREIVAVLGGTVELRSTPGLGSTFLVSLPPADAVVQPAAV